MYDNGFRRSEVLKLRVCNTNLQRFIVKIHKEKGNEDRVTLMPEYFIPFIEKQLSYVRALHLSVCEIDYGFAHLSQALQRKFGHSSRGFCWQYVFPSTRLFKKPRNTQFIGRYHIHNTSLQRTVNSSI